MSEKAHGPPLRWEVIEMSFLKEIYESDQAIYPAPELSVDRLTSWAAARPEFFLCLRHDDKDQDADLTQAGACYGVIIIVPLMKQHWEKLLGMADRDHGDAKHATSEHVFREHHIDAATMFPFSEDQNSVGLHVFHIERFTSFTNACQKTSFTDIALQEIQNRVAKNFPQWTIHGYSALVATSQGHRAFRRNGFTSQYVETLDKVKGHEDSLLNEPDFSQAQMMKRFGNEPF